MCLMGKEESGGITDYIGTEICNQDDSWDSENLFEEQEIDGEIENGGIKTLGKEEKKMNEVILLWKNFRTRM